MKLAGFDIQYVATGTKAVWLLSNINENQLNLRIKELINVID